MASFLATGTLLEHLLVVCLLLRTILVLLHEVVMLLLFGTVAQRLGHGCPQLVVENVVGVYHLVWWEEGLATVVEVLMVGGLMVVG